MADRSPQLPRDVAKIVTVEVKYNTDPMQKLLESLVIRIIKLEDDVRNLQNGN